MARTIPRGFTLIELMIVVAILGVLAAIAIPTYIRYIKETKTSEAHLMLKTLSDGGVAYYQRDHLDGDGIPLAELQFPTLSGAFGDTTFTQMPAAVPAATKVDTASMWTTRPWNSLNFRIARPHYYQYEYGPVNSAGGNDHFTSRANGDLDGDSIYSTFQVLGSGYGRGEVKVTPVHALDNDLTLE